MVGLVIISVVVMPVVKRVPAVDPVLAVVSVVTPFGVVGVRC